MVASILAAVPDELQHLAGSAVLESLGRVLEEFMDKELLQAHVASEIVKFAAEALEQKFEETPISETAVNFDFGQGIVNYRFDDGKWDIVVQGPLDLSVVESDNQTMALNTGLLGIVGTGPGLVRGNKEPGKNRRKRKLQEDAVDEDLDDF